MAEPSDCAHHGCAEQLHAAQRGEGMTDTRALGVSTQLGCVPEAGHCTDPLTTGGNLELAAYSSL